MVAWPAALPTLRIPVTYGMRDNVIRTPMEIGKPETRRRSTVRFFPFSNVVRFTDAEATTFRVFWEDDLADGTLTFTLAVGPPYSATLEFLFSAAPEFTKAGRHHIANLQLWVVG